VAKRATSQDDFKHTWFLQEWMALYGKKQSALTNELGWSKAKASDVWNGQQYTQAIIDELAPWLNVKPHELLMHPEDAMALRGLRQTAAVIARQAEEPEHKEPARKAG
jgi:transcriptional regulator with XRE-family HTH domain